MVLIPTDQILESQYLAPSASPSWWGADSRCHRLRLVDGTGVIERLMHPDALAYSSPTLLVAAAQQAGVLGLGPEIVAADSASGQTVAVELAETWRTATIDDFIDRSVLSRLAEALRRVRREMTVDAPVTTVFDDIRQLLAVVDETDPTLPVDFAWLVSLTMLLEKWIPFDPSKAVFCHNTGDASNIMISPTGMRILDWDLARKVDPLQDIGVMLAELAYLPVPEREVFAVLSFGACDADYLIARAYGIAEHLRQGLIGVWRGAREPGTIEYTKFADWHFLLLREELKDRRNDFYFVARQELTA
jgi:hypothetical protein